MFRRVRIRFDAPRSDFSQQRCVSHLMRFGHAQRREVGEGGINTFSSIVARERVERENVTRANVGKHARTPVDRVNGHRVNVWVDDQAASRECVALVH